MKVVKNMRFDITSLRPDVENPNRYRQQVIDSINCQVIDPLNMDDEVARNIFNGGSVNPGSALRGRGAELDSTDAASRNYTPSNLPEPNPPRGNPLAGTKIDGSEPFDSGSALWDKSE
jgi:hypothetical protein